ncbi:WecB/TagA/CpsF family glycosyltransferase [Glaciimonas immobilis]|uniref:Beta-1,4-glucosyltransferase n=1 Tax=Glaciimonas immobilis TaxID=728004 RepID=A0A840RRF0_9BURK|nr:WecB/TagA/CpsF family glycosyltransferase [Glaciimonas immobilis]KAF3998022.1 WecB/TagA/CpsF family glycosyltransferase [Glaciimonas immobilis]MBB5199294.1 beta-1,4-glucosyltransferase [Glaciimonas immobilis]
MKLEKMIPIAGYPVLKTNSPVLAAVLRRTVRVNKKMTLFFANTNFIVQCRYLLDRMRSDSVIIVNDGVGMDIAAFLFAQEKFDENLNGTDFIPYFFSGSNRSLRVFMIGSKPEVLAKAAQHARENLGQTVVGTCDGYAGLNRNFEDLIETINAAQAEVVLVALGNPVQEEWILASRDLLNANLVIGVGALFDFWSGEKLRAPAFLQRVRLEWFYRLCLEPRRLVRRYTIDIMRFMLLCSRYRKDI